MSGDQVTSKVVAPVPVPQPGVSLIVAWRLKGQPVLVIGSGNVATGRVFSALEAEAKVTIISPSEPSTELSVRIERAEVEFLNRKFEISDLHLKRWALVLAAIDDQQTSEEIARICREQRIPVNCADIPHLCDFWYMSTHRDGPLQIAVSTNGTGPRLASIVRRHIEDHLPKGIALAIEKIGTIRSEIRRVDPDHLSSTRRMTWISRLCDKYSMTELGSLSSDHVATLVEQYLSQKEPDISVPSTPSETSRPRGRIALVGAGPGDPELLTRAAYKAITTADLILADNLVPQMILDVIPPNIPLIMRGPTKEGQSNFNQTGLDSLREGKYVVRLKAGDPFIFGRGAEEVLFYRKYGFEAQIIPGVSSSYCAPQAVGIPVTHRGIADQILITTGHGSDGSIPDIPPFCDHRTTVFLMGVSRLPVIVTGMKQNGYPLDWPVAVIEKATWTDQRAVYGTISNICEVVVQAQIKAPATIVVGKVVHLGSFFSDLENVGTKE